MKINLIPEVKQEQIKVQKTNALVTLICIVVGVIVASVALLLLALVLGRTAQIKGDNDAISTLNTELNAYADFEKTVINVEQGITDVKSILGTKNKWKSFFTELEKVTPGDIRFRSINISSDGKVTADLEGANVGSIDRFIKSFSSYKTNDKNLFSGVYVGGYSLNDNGHVVFSANFSINEENL